MPIDKQYTLQTAQGPKTLAELFDGPVDVVSREGLKPYLRPAATTDAIYAF